MLLSSWMVVYILLEDVIMIVTTFPYIELLKYVECIPSVDHVMIETDALQMILV